MTKYNVLWIDDIFNNDFDRLAYQNGINLCHFKTSKAGIRSLEDGFDTITHDAVILDGLAFNESEDEEHDIEGLINSLNRIKELRKKRWIPVFIFTGELDKMEYSGDMKWIEKYDVPIIIKGVDNRAFIKEVIRAVEGQEIFELKNKYPDIFSLCQEEYIGEKEIYRVLQIIKDIESPHSIVNEQERLTPMRKVLEAIFDKLNRIGLIPDEVQFGNGNFNGAGKFIAKKNQNYIYKEDLIDPVIAEMISFLSGFSQDGSHNRGKSLEVDSYLSQSTNPFLYLSLCFSLIEVLGYLKRFIDNNSNKELNQNKWMNKVIYRGEIEQDEENNYYCGEYLLNYSFVNGSYEVGQEILIIKVVPNTNSRTRNLYSQYAQNFRIADD